MLLPFSKAHQKKDDPFINLLVSAGNTDWVFQASPFEPGILAGSLDEEEVGFNGLQRKCANLMLAQAIRVSVYNPTTSQGASIITISIDLLKKGGKDAVIISVDEFTTEFRKSYGSQVFRVGQILAMDFNGVKVDLQIEALEFVDIGMMATGAAATGTGKGAAVAAQELGQVLDLTAITLQRRAGSKTPLQLQGGNEGTINIFNHVLPLFSLSLSLSLYKTKLLFTGI